MEQSYLVELIKTLTEEEKKHMLSFSSLPFFNSGRSAPEVAQLLKICLEYDWSGDNTTLDKRDLFDTIYPGHPLVEGKLEKLISEAYRIARTFLTVQCYTKDENEFQQTFDFAELLRERGLKARYAHFVSRLRKIQEKALFKNAKYYYHQALLENAIHFDEALNNIRKGDLNIHNVLYATEMYTQIRKLALLNRYQIQFKGAKIESTELILDTTKNFFTPSYLLDESPYLSIYQRIYQILKTENYDINEIRNIFHLVKKREDEVDNLTLQEFYSYLRNFCILLMYKDVEDIAPKVLLHEIYVYNLENGFLFFQGKITPSRMASICRNAITIGELNWVGEFIVSCKEKIMGDNETRDYYRYLLAEYLFQIGQYEECLDTIPHTAHDIDYLAFNKRLEIKALYETKSEILLYKIDAFKMFMSRNGPKLYQNHFSRSHVEFANLLTQICHSKPGDQKRAERLMGRIQQKRDAAEWAWLMSKAQALLNT